jgi:hypothetical protein
MYMYVKSETIKVKRRSSLFAPGSVPVSGLRS